MLDIVPIASNRYSPQEEDTLLGVIVQKTFEFFTVDINSEFGHANLRTLEFQGATKTNKPRFDEGTLIFCRVLKVDKLSRVELTCIHPGDKKSWNSGEATYRELKGGFLKDFPIGFCRSLLAKEVTPGQKLLEALGTRFHFDIYIGYNGRIWVNSEKPASIIFIFNALERLVEMT
jgi:exosome complex component RRP40